MKVPKDLRVEMVERMGEMFTVWFENQKGVDQIQILHWLASIDEEMIIDALEGY